MKSRVLICTLALTSSLSYGGCVPPRVSVQLPSGTVSEFYLHPDGTLAIVKDPAGTVSIVDLRTGTVTYNRTELSPESIPLAASWSHVAYPYQNGTRFVSLNLDGQSKEETFEVPSKILMTANLPGKSEKGTKLRFLTSEGKLEDVFLSRGKIIPGEVRALCANLASPVYPIALSPDGSRLLASTLKTTHLFRFRSDATCEAIDDFPYLTGSAAFDFASAKNRSFAFEAPRTIVVSGLPKVTMSIIVFNEGSKKMQKVSLDEETATAPSFLRDGRVSYLEQIQKRIVVVDPSQLDGEGKPLTASSRCIQGK